MRIGMVGVGYVGLVSGACFSEFGVDVVCMDKDRTRIDGLRRGEIPIYEPGLRDLIENNLRAGRLRRRCSMGGRRSLRLRAATIGGRGCAAGRSLLATCGGCWRSDGWGGFGYGRLSRRALWRCWRAAGGVWRRGGMLDAGGAIDTGRCWGAECWGAMLWAAGLSVRGGADRTSDRSWADPFCRLLLLLLLLATRRLLLRRRVASGG